MEKNENGFSVLFENGAMGTGCSCGMKNRQLAMVYSPMQCWRKLYSPDAALAHGTLFEELHKPLEECNE